MDMRKVCKKILAFVLALLMTMSSLPMSQMVETYAATATKLYLKPNSNWTVDNAWFAAYFFEGNANTWRKMTDNDGDGIYECDVPSGYSSVIFCRMNPSSSTLSWDYKWNQTADLTVPTDGTNLYTVADGTWDNGGGTWSIKIFGYFVAGSSSLCGENWDTFADPMTANADGTYSITFSNIAAGTHTFKVVANGDYLVGSWPENDYVLNITGPSDVVITYDPVNNTGYARIYKYYNKDAIELDESSVFYADVDLVDYLNNNRVFYDESGDYYTDNQGEWLGSKDAVYSYLNNLISQQVANGNQYSYPLYFGPLHFIKSRYSLAVGSDQWLSLGNWSSAANVALAANSNGDENTSAVVQGLVGSTLDTNGNLTDPLTGASLLYFNQTAAEEWKNEGHKVMDYYAGLKFPFKKTYNETTRVTTYSYNSAEDYAVYYDYDSNYLYASDTYVLDQKGNKGFYPLNAPGDADNEVNNGFGAKFTIDFTVGDDGYLANGDPVTFEFTGDDDVWVFIDGQLVLDMGGAHAMANGTIDFAKKEVTVTNAASVQNGDLITSNPTYEKSTFDGQGLSNYLYDRDSEDAFYERAVVETSTTPVSFESLGLNFDYNQVHTMTVFYMERGMYESNFSMEFTMVPVPSGLTISKNFNDADINEGLLDEVSSAQDFNFSLSATSPSDTSVAFSKYTLTEKYTGEDVVMSASGTTSGRTYTADINGITNYVYAHSFFTNAGEDAFISGTAFSIVETTNGIFRYSGTTWAIYDAKNGYQNITSTVKSSTADTSSKTAAFTMGSANDSTAYSYAVSFTNTMLLGNLQISKIFEDEVLKDTKFQFNVYLDLDGDGDAFKPQMYPGLVYTVGGEPCTSEKGEIIITGGQTALISGIPAGATYTIEEVIPEGAAWVNSGSTGDTGSITNGGTATATFTNVVKTVSSDRVIFVEAGTATDYAIKYNGQTVSITAATAGQNDLDVTVSNGQLIVTGANPDARYTLTYEGRLADDSIITGTVTVYTFAATQKVYVFDFGLSSDLADITYGDGLFQGGNFYNSLVSGEKATLATIVGADDNLQTTITYTAGSGISDNGTSFSVIFSAVAFMSRVETYTYTVQIAAGEDFDPDNPETGCIVTGFITVMPANSVYYEDNFNATDNSCTDKIIFTENAPTNAPTMEQSNDQSSNYGYDSCYNKGYAESNGSDTTLSSGQYAYFTFTGTGFDLISSTNGTTAGFAVYVFEGGHADANVTYMSTFKGATPVKTVFVDTYYNNGDLEQVPVVSVRGLNNSKTYTAYIQALATSDKLKTVTIDGIRIYDPMQDTSAYPLVNERNTAVDEFRSLYAFDKIVSLAGRTSSTVFQGLGKQSVVQQALSLASIVENMDGETISCAADIESIYLHGPNNEMYLPKNFGIAFSYEVTGSDFTLQIGAKAVSAKETLKSFTVYARSKNGTYTEVDTITLTSATDMYYDLTQKLCDMGFAENGQSYDIIIISNSEYANNEFVSLTTVKHSGITLS